MNKSLVILLTIALAFVIVFVFWIAKSAFNNDLQAEEPNANVPSNFASNTNEDFSVESSEEESSLTEQLESYESEPFLEETLAITESLEHKNDDIENTQPEESNSIDLEASDQIPEEKLLLDKYIGIVSDGVFKITITKQQQIGGLSIPVLTSIWYGDGYVNIVEAEMHNISSEMFILGDKAYLLNIAENYADLICSKDIEIPNIELKELTYIKCGSATVGSSVFYYERYKTKDKSIVDFLFVGEELKKVKVYKNDTDYELIGVEISDSINDGRKELPDDIKIIDRR